MIPDAPQAETPAEVTAHQVIITLGDRRYRIRGLEKNQSFELLKINLLVSRPAFDGAGEAMHVDSFDLYQQRPRGAFIKQAAVELGLKADVIKGDLSKILRKLETLQAEKIQAAQSPKEKAVTLDDAETKAALDLLKSSDLLTRIQNDFTRCGVVGEATNKLVGYLAAISRKLDTPLGVTIQSTSAAGKSALMDAVLAFMPAEARIKYSAMTGQSLFYMGETDLQHKVLAIVDDRTRTRRDHEMYLTLIDSLALLHQHQRPVRTINHSGQPIRYVEVTLDDIGTANYLAHEVLGRTLDELPPQTRKLLRLILALVAERCTAQEIKQSDYRFSRREIREHTSWGHTQLKIHLKRLEELEYLLVHRGGRGQSFVYELLYDGDTEDDQPHLSGLIDVEALRQKQVYDEKKSGQISERSGSGRPQVGGMSGGGRDDKNDRKPSEDKGLCDLEDKNPEKALIRPTKGNGSYRSYDPALNAKADD